MELRLLRLGLSDVEKALRDDFRPSTKAEKVVFNLTELEWSGYFPSLLLFAWAAALRQKHKVPVDFRLPDRDHVGASVRKMLLDNNVLHALHELGCGTPYHSAPKPAVGLPLRVLPSTLVKAIKSRDFVGLTAFFSEEEVPFGPARDTLAVVIRELAENACWHGGSILPYYGISFSESSGGVRPGASKGLMAPYSESTRYAEIAFGDLGPGINKLMGSHVRKDYVPMFQDGKHRYTHDERVIALAFEFSSTSDEAARERRLRHLIAREDIEPSHIASGLFCVLEVVRAQHGQLIIRTPKAVLSLDFRQGSEVPIIKGKRDLGLSSTIAPLPGTHYLVRLPLSGPSFRNRVAQFDSLNFQVNVSASNVVDAFPSELEGDWGRRLHVAIGRMDSALARLRMQPGVTIIPPLAEVPPTRVAALFLAALRSMNHGSRRVVWLNEGPTLQLVLSLASHTVYETRLPIEATSVMIGDVLANKFWIAPSEEVGRVVSLSRPALSGLQDTYGSYLSQSLQRRIQSAAVRKVPGPFLIPGQYYTRVFYEVGAAVADASTRQELANWCVLRFDEPPEVVVSSSSLLAPLLDAINQRLEYLGKRAASVLIYNADLGTPGNVAATMAFVGKRAVVITDVVCRGRALQRILHELGMLDLVQVLAVVDARADVEIGRPVALGFEGDTRAVKLDSIISETIEPLYDTPREQGSEDGVGDIVEERVYVIDEKTNAPTLYVRAITPEKSFDEILDGPVTEGRCLVAGHSALGERHYTYFLNLPRLFSSMRSEITAWIQRQMNYVNQSARTAEGDWNALVYNQDESLAWVISDLGSLEEPVSVKVVLWKHLEAPEPPTTRTQNGKWLVLVPAMESGEVARRCVELVSRRFPAEILFLCVVSRMRPYQLSFFSGISGYRGARLHSSFFIRFPVSAYGTSPEQCPICADLQAIERLRDNCREESVRDIEAILDRKIAAGQPMQVGFLEGTEEELAPSERDLVRARLRGLYEASGFDLETRRHLNRTLDEESELRDRMLEIIAVERLAPEFSMSNLEVRLYRALELLYGRLEEVLWDLGPPYPLGRVVGAMLHLMPLSFAGAAGEMIRRFWSSPRDVEEVLVGLCRLQLDLPESGEVMTFLRGNDASDLAELVRQAVSLIASRQRRDAEAFDSALEALQELWARFARSNPFATGLDALVQRRISSSASVRAHVGEMLSAWNSDVSSYLSAFVSSPVWSYLSRRDADFAISVGRIDQCMARLGLLYRLDADDRGAEGGEESGAQMVAIGEELREAVNTVRERISSMVINPARCSVFRLGPEILAADGSRLSFERSIDQHVAAVFCDGRELESAVGEIVDNWRKHKRRNRAGERVWARLYQRDNRVVVLELGDDIEGEFDVTSNGGVRTIRRFGSNFGVGVEFRRSGDCGAKSVVLTFRPVEIGF